MLLIFHWTMLNFCEIMSKDNKTMVNWWCKNGLCDFESRKKWFQCCWQKINICSLLVPCFKSTFVEIGALTLLASLLTLVVKSQSKEMSSETKLQILWCLKYPQLLYESLNTAQNHSMDHHLKIFVNYHNFPHLSFPTSLWLQLVPLACAIHFQVFICPFQGLFSPSGGHFNLRESHKKPKFIE